MIQNFTPNDVLLATSGELSEELQLLLKFSMQEDPELDNFSSALQTIDREMERMIPKTDEQQVQQILKRVQAIAKQD